MRQEGWNDFYARASDWVVETARTKPEALLLLGAGCALLLRTATSLGRSRQDDNGRTRRTAAARYAEDVRERATDTAADYADSVGAYASSASSTVQDSVARMIRDQPFVVAAVGLAAGALTAALLPTTEFEEETLGEYGEALYDTAAQTGESLKNAAYAAGERLKDSAQEHGMNADGLKEVARDAAQTFAATARGGQGGTSAQQSETTG